MSSHTAAWVNSQIRENQYYRAAQTASGVFRVVTDLLGAGVHVGQAAYQQFFGDAQDVINSAVDTVSNLDVDAITSVFGKAGVGAFDKALHPAAEKALQRAATRSANALVRRYTNQPGVQEKDVMNCSRVDTLLIDNVAWWKHVDGLANDEVFLVQKIFITHSVSSASAIRMGLIPYRPWGPFQHTGGVDFYPGEGEHFNPDDMGVNSIRDFTNRCAVNWHIATSDNGHGMNVMIDLAPNFIPLRSYTIMASNVLADLDVCNVQLFGKTVKWLLPFEAFD